MPYKTRTRSDGQPTDAPYRSADLARLLSFAITAAALPVRRCGQTRPKLDENTESEAVPTLIRPWSRSKSRQLPCADVAASLGVLAPLRIDQSFASGSIVLDEWSDVPLDLQPYLADFIRWSIFPVTGITIKIGAIEHRSRFRAPVDNGGYVGIELGADATADVNLDDFMVFDNDAARAKDFFREFFYKHFRSAAETNDGEVPSTPRELIRRGFTQSNAFDEFVRAVEGVPRDAINIISLAAQRALDDAISVPDIRSAANTWYQRDKQSAVASTPDALHLLRWIIDQVIGERRARAFLLLSDTRHDLIDSLFDSRVLHNLKRNISAHDQPGVRYDVYKLDFGCYIDLIATARAPLGLLQLDDLFDDTAQFVEVPPDDYRSIRRAILDLKQFEISS